jgi:ribulose-5-phosphate 4-epimerase/fuculose-1-phosphate aldolase
MVANGQPSPKRSRVELDACRRARIDLAAVYRLLDKMDLNEGICNHLTAMVPGTTDRFLCVRYGLLWSEVTASNLVLLDASGKILEGEGPIETTAFEIHRAIHLADPKRYQCVLHTHMPHSTALCLLEPFELKMVHQNSCRFHDEVAYDPEFRGLVLDDQEGTRLANALAGKRVLFHRAHGVIVCGESIAAAFDDLYYLERAAQVQVLAMSACAAPGSRLATIEPQMAKHVKQQMDAGKAEWAAQHLDALKRGLAREDASYAE